MTRDDALKRAAELALVDERPQTVWLAGPGCYVVTSYQERDEEHDGFVQKVNPTTPHRHQDAANRCLAEGEDGVERCCYEEDREE